MIKNLLERAQNRRPKHILIFCLAGLTFGLFILFFTGLRDRWIISYTIGFTILFVAMTTRTAKLFFLALFSLTLPVIAINYLGKLTSTHVCGPPGFYYTFLDFPLLILFVLWIPELLTPGSWKLKFSNFEFCFFGIIVMSFLSIYNAVDVKLCFYSILQLIKMYLIFFYFANCIRTETELKHVTIFILVGLFVQVLLGILQYSHGETFGLELLGERKELYLFLTGKEALSRVSGTLGHPNDLARYLVTFLPLSLSLSIRPPNNKLRIFCCIIFFAGFTTLILTLSRAAWGSFVISLLALSFLFLKKPLRLSFPGFLKIISTICIIIILGYLLKGLIFTRLFSDDYGSARSRIPMIQVGLNMIKAHPFLGVGINNHSEVWHLYDNTPEKITSGELWGVHNSYLLLASEIGIFGLSLFLAFIILLFRQALKNTNNNLPFVAFFSAGCIGGFVAFLTMILVDPIDLVRPTFISFWMLSGLTISPVCLNNFNLSINAKHRFN